MKTFSPYSPPTLYVSIIKEMSDCEQNLTTFEPSVPPMSQGMAKPVIDHGQSYTKYERIAMGLAHYHAELREFTDYMKRADKGECFDGELEVKKKPIVLQIAKMYDIHEATLRRHIKNPGQRNIQEANADKQLLTVTEEKVLVERLLFLDDFNVIADKTLLYTLAHAILHRRDPTRTIGRDWFYRFLARHPECRYLTVKSICTTRSNAVNRNTMKDFFDKVINQMK